MYEGITILTHGSNKKPLQMPKPNAVAHLIKTYLRGKVNKNVNYTCILLTFLLTLVKHPLDNNDKPKKNLAAFWFIVMILAGITFLFIYLLINYSKN